MTSQVVTRLLVTSPISGRWPIGSAAISISGSSTGKALDRR